MSFQTNDSIRVQLSNCDVTCRPVGGSYFEDFNGIPYIRLSVRIQNVAENAVDSVCCLFDEFSVKGDIETDQTVESIMEVLRARKQVFNIYLRPRGDKGQPLTYRNWMNLRKKCGVLVSSLGIEMKSKPVILPSVDEVEKMTVKRQASLLKKVEDVTKNDLFELSELIQVRVDELKGSVGSSFSFRATTSFYGVNYQEKESSDGENTYLVRYLNIKYVG